EPVLGGALSGTQETFLQYSNNPTFYAANPGLFYNDLSCASPVPADASCTFTPAGNGSFSQSVQRLGLYAQDSWRVTESLTVNYGLRWDTTFGLFTASGREQNQNAAYLTLRALQIPLYSGVPHDYRKALQPRIGIAYAPGKSEKTVIRAGFGLYFNDLAQNGWVEALQALNSAPGVCVAPGDPGCLPGANFGGVGGIIDPRYHTPYAIHATAGIQHAINDHWTLSADYTRETGMHAYRGYSYTGGVNLFTPLLPQSDPAQADLVPNLDVFKSDNRSSYDALMIRLQGNMRRANLSASYTLASAKTWGCTVGELFDYVNGVCDPLTPFAAGDYGPSGEDVRHRFVLVGTVHAPLGFEISTLSQFESGRPFTLANGGDRAVINGIKTSLDQFRGTPYIQIDLRVARPFNIRDRATVMPFIEFFNLFNRNNPANNYVADVAALPVPPSEVVNGNITHLCADASCTTLVPITSLNQLRQPAGALGDFFGPGTTVGIPFSAQIGVRVTF
ncbi:MAG TPA: TonB-dependent receptor, partial [Terriglobales bacterium]|nr:TonB-dependent receptor [Terriglobales bacterium]